MIGKVSPEDLKRYVFTRTGKDRDSVLVGPAYGEDTAAIQIGDRVLVVNSDPIIFAAEGIGTLGINIASNDVAASGADPEWLTVTYLLPAEDGKVLDKITDQIDRASKKLGIAVVGGHSEFVPILNRPFLGLTCLGMTDKFISTGGAEPGDAIILTKGAGIEGTGIIATDFYGEVSDKVEEGVIRRGAENLDRLSVIPESTVLREYANSMHDPTEGGIIDGLLELGVASGLELHVNSERIITSSETDLLCAAMDVDPLKIFGSGALVATLPEDDTREAIGRLEEEGIPSSVIGQCKSGEAPGLYVDDEVYRDPIRDQLYDLWE